MITAEQSKALQKAGLSHVCTVFGEIKSSDGSDLSKDDMAKAAAILKLGVTGEKPGKSHKKK